MPMKPKNDLLIFTPQGIYCPRANIYIDPTRRVDYAIITHAHADHARKGMKRYLAHHDCVPLLKLRLGADISIRGVDYGEMITVNGVRFSLHPAGHIIGSAQVKVEYQGEIWVVSGDYKLEDDGFCLPFEPIRCHTFITESTFAMPVYQWPGQEKAIEEMNQWWAENAKQGKTSILLGYSLGKAQRLLHSLAEGIGPIYTDSAVENTNQVLREHGIHLRETQQLHEDISIEDLKKALIIAPANILQSPLAAKIPDFSLANASGWMMLRNSRKRWGADQGFIISDHADWPGLNRAIRATGAAKIYVTHGMAELFSQYLQEQGLDAEVV